MKTIVSFSRVKTMVNKEFPDKVIFAIVFELTVNSCLLTFKQNMYVLSGKCISLRNNLIFIAYSKVRK